MKDISCVTLYYYALQYRCLSSTYLFYLHQSSERAIYDKKTWLQDIFDVIFYLITFLPLAEFFPQPFSYISSSTSSGILVSTTSGIPSSTSSGIPPFSLPLTVFLPLPLVVFLPLSLAVFFPIPLFLPLLYL